MGHDNWPFPFPIVRDGQAWYFDIDRGNEEIIVRRIGRNELKAIALCEGYVQSQVEYSARAHGGNPKGLYATRIRSDEGTQDGLYWSASEGTPKSPMGPLIADAAEDVKDSTKPAAGAGGPDRPIAGPLVRPRASRPRNSNLENHFQPDSLSHAAISTGWLFSHAVIESVSLEDIFSFMHAQ